MQVGMFMETKVLWAKISYWMNEDGLMAVYKSCKREANLIVPQQSDSSVIIDEDQLQKKMDIFLSCAMDEIDAVSPTVDFA